MIEDLKYIFPDTVNSFSRKYYFDCRMEKNESRILCSEILGNGGKRYQSTSDHKTKLFPCRNISKEINIFC